MRAGPNAHWAIKPKKAFATNLLTLLMTLSPSILLPEPPDILPILVCDTHWPQSAKPAQGAAHLLD